MKTTDKIKDAFERGAKALKLKSHIGKGTAVTKVHVSDGMTCQVSDGDWDFVVDMPEKHGGANKGPNSGIIGRATLGTCLAVGYVRWAAVLDVPINSIDVDVEADYDIRGEYGIDEVPPRYPEIRYRVKIDSPAPEEKVNDLIERADMLSPWLDMLREPVNVVRSIEHTQSREEATHES